MSAETIQGFIAVCVGFLWCGVKAVQVWVRLARAASWVTVPGVVLQSMEYVDPQRKVTHFRVRYAFVAGERIESDTARLSGDWFLNSRRQSEFVARYRVGQPVDVYHDPRNPALNCLDRTDKTGLHIYAFGSVLCFLFACFFVGHWMEKGWGA